MSNPREHVDRSPHRRCCGCACRAGVGPRRGLVRHQLARRGRAWRLLPGGRRRHLREIRPQGHDRPERRQPGAADRPTRSSSTWQGNLLARSRRVEQDIPVVDVAAIFQKDPQVLIAHPDSGVETFADLAKLPTIFMGKDLFFTGFQWMKAAFPASRTSSSSPIPSTRRRSLPTRCRPAGLHHLRALRDPEAGRFQARVFLMADAGFDTSSTMIEARRTLSRTIPTSSSASSMPRSSAGTITSTATTRPPTI